MEKIEFTNPESKELNEEVRNYLELIRDTEALIGDGMEKLKGDNWAKLWSSLDKLVFYPKTYEGNLAIFIDPDTGHIAPVMTDYDAEHRTYTLY